MSLESDATIGAAVIAVFGAIGSMIGVAYGIGKNKERIDSGMTRLGDKLDASASLVALKIEGVADDIIATRQELQQHRYEATKRADEADAARIRLGQFLVDEIKPLKAALGVAQTDIARLQGHQQ